MAVRNTGTAGKGSRKTAESCKILCISPVSWTAFRDVTKNEIADVLTDIGTLLELKGENPFKVRAYQTGARALEAMEEAELARLIKEEQLQTVKGTGEALAQKISELHTTGKLEFFEKLKASVE